jgi:predicted Zn-dependent peptidase
MTDQHEDLHPGAETESPEAGFMTDTLTIDTGVAEVPDEPDSATVIEGPDLSHLDNRPAAGEPREYHFPKFERFRLDNGLTVLSAHMPGRALLAANLVMAGGGAAEPAQLSGVTAMTGRALTEGTQQRDALAFIEASERLGAELHADASWEALTATLEVPRSRFAQAMSLLAEMILQPAFPESEIERLRDERLNDLLQAKANPRRRAERVFPEVIFDQQSPYRRPLGGSEETVRRLDRDVVVTRHAEASDPARSTLVVAGDLSGVDLPAIVEEQLGGWRGEGGGDGRTPTHSGASSAGSRLVLVDRPGSAQSELRVGHVGLPRKTPDFYTVSVLNAILGGIFDSRLNRVIREEKGYAYSIWSSFEMRRSAGPFVIRTAVETDVTGPALNDIWSIVNGMREAEVEPKELETSRDYLVGVFPLRFEVPAQVAAALAGLVIHELPDDELDRYRPAVAAVSAADILDVARREIRPSDLSIVVVGDASKVESALREANLAPVTVVAADAEL